MTVVNFWMEQGSVVCCGVWCGAVWCGVVLTSVVVCVAGWSGCVRWWEGGSGGVLVGGVWSLKTRTQFRM